LIRHWRPLCTATPSVAEQETIQHQQLPARTAARQSQNVQPRNLAILTGKFDDIRSQHGFVIGCRWNLSLRRSVLAQRPACSSLGDAEPGHHMIHARAAAGGA
jgi:hypothetical protein